MMFGIDVAMVAAAIQGANREVKQSVHCFSLNALAADAAQTAADHGFLPCDRISFPTKMMLVVTEVAEAVEHARKGDWSEVPSELADIIIRVAQAAHTMGIDLDGAVAAKMQYNAARPHLNGKEVTW